MNKIGQRLRNKFINKEYRHSYIDSYLSSSIAIQLKVLRTDRNLKQIDLARLAGMKQSRISTMENVNNEGLNITTLQRLARVFDVALIVKFESFGGALEEIQNADREFLSKPSFKDDPVFIKKHEEDEKTQSTILTKKDAFKKLLEIPTPESMYSGYTDSIEEFEVPQTGTG